MTLKALCLTTVGISTLTLAAVPICGAALQLWNPQVAEAAKVTANLLKGKSLYPIFLSRSEHSAPKARTPIAVKFAHSGELLNYGLNQRLSLDYPPINTATIQRKSASQQEGRDRPVQNADAFIGQDVLLEMQGAEFQNWQGTLEGKLAKQKYQIKKLELELAQEQYKDGKMPLASFQRKTGEYQIASQEFKAFMDSSRMAD